MELTQAEDRYDGYDEVSSKLCYVTATPEMLLDARSCVIESLAEISTSFNKASARWLFGGLRICNIPAGIV